MTRVWGRERKEDYCSFLAASLGLGSERDSVLGRCMHTPVCTHTHVHICHTQTLTKVKVYNASCQNEAMDSMRSTSWGHMIKDRGVRVIVRSVS